LDSSLNQAQFEALRARLNPRFLFNSLQNISVLTMQDPHPCRADINPFFRAVKPVQSKSPDRY
jgi:LytS/YehU family sensor histidine kinase